MTPAAVIALAISAFLLGVIFAVVVLSRAAEPPPW